MTIQNAIKKGEKITGEKVTITGSINFWNYKGYTVSFHKNGMYEDSCCFYTRKDGMEDDHYSDYFAGTFHDNLTQAFKFIDRK